MSWLIPVVCVLLVILAIVCHKLTIRKRINDLRAIRDHKHNKELEHVGRRVKFEMFKEYIENLPIKK